MFHLHFPLFHSVFLAYFQINIFPMYCSYRQILLVHLVHMDFLMMLHLLHIFQIFSANSMANLMFPFFLLFLLSHLIVFHHILLVLTHLLLCNIAPLFRPFLLLISFLLHLDRYVLVLLHFQHYPLLLCVSIFLCNFYLCLACNFLYLWRLLHIRFHCILFLYHLLYIGTSLSLFLLVCVLYLNNMFQLLIASFLLHSDHILFHNLFLLCLILICFLFCYLLFVYLIILVQLGLPQYILLHQYHL